MDIIKKLKEVYNYLVAVLINSAVSAKSIMLIWKELKLHRLIFWCKKSYLHNCHASNIYSAWALFTPKSNFMSHPIYLPIFFLINNLKFIHAPRICLPNFFIFFWYFLIEKFSLEFFCKTPILLTTFLINFQQNTFLGRLKFTRFAFSWTMNELPTIFYNINIFPW